MLNGSNLYITYKNSNLYFYYKNNRFLINKPLLTKQKELIISLEVNPRNPHINRVI